MKDRGQKPHMIRHALYADASLLQTEKQEQQAKAAPQ
jgi:hypothetical protein